MESYRVYDDDELERLVAVTYWRVIRGMTQAQVGEKVGLNQTRISWILRRNASAVEMIAKRLRRFEAA